jgi:FkbM family methyltransferase
MDAGANIGDFTVMAAKKVGPTGRVIAVEPSRVALPLLRRNVEINNLRNVTICDEVLSTPNQCVWMNTMGSYVVETSMASTESVRRTTKSPSQLLTELQVSHVDVLKMDIEGAEASALSDMTFLAGLRELALETHGVRATISVLGYLHLAGFVTRQFGQVDFVANGLRAALTHPISLISAEAATSGYATQRLLSYAGGNREVPALYPDSTVQIHYARRRGKFRKSKTR